ncbi:MAG: T9SS type A sorting domain-containing protein [Salibacteraceae bacterium]
MHKPLRFLFLFALCVATGSLSAQRYTTELFTDVTVTSDVKYGENYSVLTGSPALIDLEMDIYEPVGDTDNNRQLIIMMHAGSFLPKGTNTLPFGNKRDSSLVEMCEQFAKRGWVAASIDYRLGWNPTPDALGGDQETRAKTIIQAVYRSMQDAKTAIRFFRMDAAGANTYGIDPTRVVVGGSNSGGYVALACGNLNSIAETELFKFLDSNGDSFIDVSTLGGFEGEGGNSALNVENHPGFASNPQLVLNLGGAAGDSSWIEAGEVPVVAFHGVADALTPYATQDVIVAATGDVIVEVSGSLDVIRRNQNLGNQDVFINANFTDVYTQAAQTKTGLEGLFPFQGALNGFEPWSWYDPNDPNISTDSIQVAPGVKIPASGFGSAANPLATKTKALNYIDTIMNYFNPRAVEALQNPAPLDPPLSVSEDRVRLTALAYPNPAVENVFIYTSNASEMIQAIRLVDLTGKQVLWESGNNINYTLERGDLPTGVYFVEVQLEDSVLTKKLIFK